MANKKIWLVILVMALVFGMAVVGCDDGSKNGGSTEDNSNENGTHTTHTYGSWKYVTTNAQGKALYTRTCTVCGYTDSEYR
ncbi:MAG: hypothetical protein LBI14_03835 [Treponema sp.]|jgi:uncharacterized lipoprotein YehR (DUF1307 family)|nr:hypothetical protein [Treponema sp.]